MGYNSRISLRSYISLAEHKESAFNDIVITFVSGSVTNVYKKQYEQIDDEIRLIIVNTFKYLNYSVFLVLSRMMSQL